MRNRLHRILVLSLLIGAFHCLGCGDSQKVHEDLVAPKKITSKTGALLEPLFDSPNRIVKNNAKVAANAMEQGDYVKAAGSLQTIASLKGLSPQERTLVSKALSTLKAEVKPAAKNGDKKAEMALKLITAP